MKQNPLRVEVQLRKGVMFPAKAGVMESREFTADDVVFSFDRINKSPKKIPTYFDHVDKVEATGKHTVTFFLKSYNSEWDYRFGWGYYSGIMPKEVVAAGAANWKNVNGTGPFQVADYVQGNSLTLRQEPGVLGQRDHRRRRSTSCPSSTRSPTASSRTSRPSSPRCAPPSSTCWRRCAGATSTS